MAIVTAQVAAVQKLYVAYFNRPADHAGLDYWTNVAAANNGNTTAISAAFAAEAEYKTEYAGMSNDAIVNKVYMNLFGRAAESAGQAYWANLLDQKAFTIDQVVTQIAAGAQGTDAEAYENKVAAATAFTAALDLPAEQTGYSGAAANTAAKAFLSGVTTDATLTAATAPATLSASVAAVVKAGTPFTLAGAVASLQVTQAAKSAVLADLAEEEAVADALDDANVTGTPTDAQVEAAIKAVQTEAATAANAPALLGATFSTASAAMQTALIADRKAALNTQLTGNKTELTNANTAAGKVENLTDAIAAYTAAMEVSETAATAASLTLNAQTAALADLDALNTGAVVAAANSVSLNGNVVISRDAADEPWELAAGVTEANTKGITVALAALNANAEAQAEATDAAAAAAAALLAADILDASGSSTALAAVAAEFTFTALAEDELPTYDMILVEQQLFDDRMDSLDAAAALTVSSAPGAPVTTFFADYDAYVADLKADIAGVTNDAAGRTAATTALNAAVTAGFITAADRTAILTAAGTAPVFVAADAAAAVDVNNWEARETAFDSSVTALIAAETTAPGADAGIGNLADAVITAEGKIAATEELIVDLNAAVAAYNASLALSTDVTAAQKAVTAATKVITDEGFAAPVVLKTVGLNLSTAKDDIFMVASGDADAEVRSFGVQGQDTVYVGTTLKYNSTVIGSGTGETDLDEAGDNAVLEFFLNETSTGVEIIIENKAFGSESGGDADLTTITLVGVDLEDITVANGFITVGTPTA